MDEETTSKLTKLVASLEARTAKEITKEYLPIRIKLEDELKKALEAPGRIKSLEDRLKSTAMAYQKAEHMQIRLEAARAQELRKYEKQSSNVEKQLYAHGIPTKDIGANKG